MSEKETVLCVCVLRQSLKTWRDAGQTWVGWSQSFNVKVNRDLAVSLLSHKITVHIWNHKDKLFSERQKVLRLTLSDDTEMPGELTIICTQ